MKKNLKNMSMRDALKLAERLGCFVVALPRTGELAVWHREFPNRVRVPHPKRRKDAPASLLRLIRRVIRWLREHGLL